MITCEIITDSLNVANDSRLTTWVLTYPRFIHSELMTHRIFSRNAASSRAIPVEKMIKAIEDNPACPIAFGKNQKGMQSSAIIENQEEAYRVWLEARDNAVKNTKKLLDLGVHKQHANRLLEPFAHMTTLLSGTEFHNYFSLRAHTDAQPEFKDLAYKMLDMYNLSTPTYRNIGEWHLPFGGRYLENITEEQAKQISTARAARISYLNFDGDFDYQKDYNLHDNLSESGHWSPFEHPAQAMEENVFYGNFKGFKPYRKFFPNENRFDPRVIIKRYEP